MLDADLSDVGRAYYDRCRAVLAEAEAADALAADQHVAPRGKLRVTMPVLFGRRCVAPILVKFAQQYPALELDLSLSDSIADLAEEGYDLAIRTGMLDDKAALAARRIARQRMMVCASPSYLEMHGRPLGIEDLGRHQAIIYSRSGRRGPWQFQRDDGPAVEVAPVSRLRFDNLDAIADAATAGHGIAWLPSWLVRERVAHGALVTLLPDHPPFLYDCHAVWLRTPRLPRKVRLAVDALAETLPRLMR